MTQRSIDMSVAPWPRAALLLCLMLPSLCIAGVEIADVGVGFGGRYRVGRWTPVRICLQSDGGAGRVRLELRTLDGDGVESVTAYEEELAAGESSIIRYLKFGRVDGYLEVRIVGAGSTLAAKRLAAADLPDAVRSSQQLVVTLGQDFGGSAALEVRRARPGEEAVHAVVETGVMLPDRWLGYDGVNLVLMSAGEGGIPALLSEQQLDALEQWVLLGGRLIVSGGESAADEIAAGGRLARFVPGRFDRLQVQRRTVGLENYVGRTAKRLDSFIPEGELSFRLPLARILDTPGRVEAYEGFGDEQTPTIIRSSHGFGQILFVALDLDRPPLTQWVDGRQLLLAKLLGLSLGPVPNADGDQSFDLSRVGYDDLTGQLRGSLDQFGEVRMVPFSWIAGLIMAYILLIGPADYFLLRRWGKRFGWTWFTFPLLVVLGCAVAAWLTQSWKGDQVRVNQVDIVDVDAASGLLRGNVWSHIFSPRSAKYNLELTPAVAMPRKESAGHRDAHATLLSWQGLPGASYGGMNTSRTLSENESYTIRCDLDGTLSSKLVNLPIPVYSSRSLHGVFVGDVEVPVMEPLEANSENQLRGTVRNPLNAVLLDCLLCYDRWAYPLGSIVAGGAVSLSRTSSAKSIDTLMTRSRVDQDFKDLSEPWRRDDQDLERILEMMIYHEAAGGFQYTSLLHRHQQEVDISIHLKQGRAVLVGRTDKPASRLEPVDARVSSTTYYRIFLPVKPYQLSAGN